MESKEFFWWLVNYHVHENLSESLNASPKGVSSLEGVIARRDGMPFSEGDESSYYQGLLFLTDGVRTLRGLDNSGWIPEDGKDELEGFTYVSGMEDFFAYLKHKKAEGEGEGTAYVFNTETQVVMNVPEFINSPRKSLSLTEDLAQKTDVEQSRGLSYALPEDFLSLDKDVPVRDRKLGTKTRLAIRHTRADGDVKAYQIKRTVKGKLGMGTVTYFDHNGLREEFILDYRPEHKGEFIDFERKIVGIYRLYRDENDKPVRQNGWLVPCVERFIGMKELTLPVREYSRRVA